MYFHLILTDDCNLCCSYCRAKAFDNLEESAGEQGVHVDENLPLALAYNLKILYCYTITSLFNFLINIYRFLYPLHPFLIRVLFLFFHFLEEAD